MKNPFFKLTDMDRAMLGAIMIDAVRPVRLRVSGGGYAQRAMLGDMDVCEYTIKFIKWELMSSNTDDGYYHLTKAGMDEI